jgi:nucleotide-binding universal stress UspA family protein
VTRTRISSVFHPSDFSPASEIAFAHALKIALISRATLHMLHVEPGQDLDWSKFPGVRATLEKWGLIPENSPKRAVIDLGIDVTKVVTTSRSPVRACVNFLDEKPADIIVLAVHQYSGSTSWLERRVGEPIARHAGEMTLFIPDGRNGFVSLEDGSVSLQRILIPIAHTPSAQPAVDAACRLIHSLKLASGAITLLYVGSQAEAPLPRTPQSAWSWTLRVEEGDPAERIVEVAQEEGSDLIMMTTEGPHGFLDALRGSTSQNVLRRTPCPVLSLPVTSQRAH